MILKFNITNQHFYHLEVFFEPKNDNKIIILGSCEWFKNLQGIPLFKAVAASMDDNFFQLTSPLNPKKLNITKYRFCGPWNDEKVNQTMIIKLWYEVVVSYF